MKKFRCIVHSLEPNLDDNIVPNFSVFVNGEGVRGVCGKEVILPESHIEILNESKRYTVVKLSMVEDTAEEETEAKPNIEIKSNEGGKKIPLIKQKEG